MDWLWPSAERAELPVGLMASNFLPMVGKIAERHPNLRLLIDHMGRRSGTKDEAAFANLTELLALAKYPNVAVKVTRVSNYSSEEYPYRNIHTYLHQIYDSFGPERMFWGTDITCLSCTLRQSVTLFTEELPWLSQSDKELIMGKALCDWIGWKLTNHF
jgi:predicted TIM-barrel fold metal-dependent hydrolase